MYELAKRGFIQSMSKSKRLIRHTNAETSFEPAYRWCDDTDSRRVANFSTQLSDKAFKSLNSKSPHLLVQTTIALLTLSKNANGKLLSRRVRKTIRFLLATVIDRINFAKFDAVLVNGATAVLNDTLHTSLSDANSGFINASLRCIENSWRKLSTKNSSTRSLNKFQPLDAVALV